MYFKFVSFIAGLIWRKRKVVTQSEIDNIEPAVYICNHSGILGPVVNVKYFNKPKRIWLTCAMIDKVSGPNYFFHDMMLGRGSKNPKKTRRLAKFVFKLIYPLIHNNKRFIIVNKSSRDIIKTFNESVDTLKSKQNIIIFPELHERYGKYINTFYRGFVTLGKYYYNETGKKLKFYPMYVPNGIRTINIGDPIEYNPDNNKKDEANRICEYLQEQIEQIGASLEEHKVIPYVPSDFYKYYGEYEFDEIGFFEFVNQPYSE